MLRLSSMTSLAVTMTAASLFAADPPGSITFHRDVLPILAKDCQECHRPGQMGCATPALWVGGIGLLFR